MIDLGNDSSRSASSLVMQPSLAKLGSGSSATREPVEIMKCPAVIAWPLSSSSVCESRNLAKARINSKQPSRSWPRR